MIWHYTNRHMFTRKWMCKENPLASHYLFVQLSFKNDIEFLSISYKIFLSTCSTKESSVKYNIIINRMQKCSETKCHATTIRWLKNVSPSSSTTWTSLPYSNFFNSYRLYLCFTAFLPIPCFDLLSNLTHFVIFHTIHVSGLIITL